MTEREWREFLERYAAALMATHEEPEGGWRSFPPATPEAIAATEKRLGATLPPSLRSFYAVTNGWPYDVGSYGFLRPLPVEEIGWFRDVSPKSDLLTGLLTADDGPQFWRDVSAVLDDEGNLISWVYGPPIANEKPSGDEENELVAQEKARDKLLLRCLVVTSEGEEAACWILDPQTVNAQGEWAACCPEVVMPGDDGWEPEGFAALFRREAEFVIEDAFEE